MPAARSRSTTANAGQVADVVAGEQHRAGPRLFDQPAQHAALVEAGRPQLQHHLAGVHLQPELVRPAGATTGASRASSPSGAAARRVCTTSASRLSSTQTAGVGAGRPPARPAAATGPRSPPAGSGGVVSEPACPPLRAVLPLDERPGTESRPPSSTTTAAGRPVTTASVPTRPASRRQHLDRAGRRPRLASARLDDRRQHPVVVQRDQRRAPAPPAAPPTRPGRPRSSAPAPHRTRRHPSRGSAVASGCGRIDEPRPVSAESAELGEGAALGRRPPASCSGWTSSAGVLRRAVEDGAGLRTVADGPDRRAARRGRAGRRRAGGWLLAAGRGFRHLAPDGDA